MMPKMFLVALMSNVSNHATRVFGSEVHMILKCYVLLEVCETRYLVFPEVLRRLGGILQLITLPRDPPCLYFDNWKFEMTNKFR